MTSVSQSLAKLRSPAVLVAQNGSSVALPNYMADEVEETRANIVAALCGSAAASPLTCTSGIMGPHHGSPAAAAMAAAAGSTAPPSDGSPASSTTGGRRALVATDSDDEIDTEDAASRPRPQPPLPARSRRVLPPGSPALGVYVLQRSFDGSGDGSPRRPVSGTPAPTSPRLHAHVPLASFADGSLRRPMTSVSDSAAAPVERPSPLSRGAGSGSAAGACSLFRRPLSASTSTQAQVPLDPFAAAAAAQRDLIAAVTGRVIQAYDFDDDSLDEEELANDLAAAQSTLARALEMARSGTTAVSASPRASCDTASSFSTLSSLAATAAGGSGGARLSTRHSAVSPVGSSQVVEVEIKPSASAGAATAARWSEQQHQQQQQQQALREGGAGGRLGRGEPVPSPAGLQCHPNPSGSSGGGGGLGLPLRRALHLDGSAAGVTAAGEAARGDVELGQAGPTAGGGAVSDSVGGGGGGAGIGRFTVKDSASWQAAAASGSGGSDGSVTARGARHSNGGDHGTLKGLLKLAKRAFRRSAGGAAVASSPPPSPPPVSPPTTPPLVTSQLDGGRLMVSPVAMPRTPPAQPGSSPSAVGSPEPATAMTQLTTTWQRAATAASYEGAPDVEGSSATAGVSSGRPLPASPVVTASAASSVVQSPYVCGSASGRDGPALTMQPSPASPPLSSTISAPAAAGPLPAPSQRLLPQLQSWSECGGEGSGARSSMQAGLTPPASAPPLYGSGAGGLSASQRRRSSTVSAGGAYVSELQVTAHVQSFMHYQQQMLQQQLQQQQQQQQQPCQHLQPRLSSSFTVGRAYNGGGSDDGDSLAVATAGSRSASGEARQDREPDWRAASAKAAAAAAKMPYQPGGTCSDCSGWRQVPVPLPLPPPPPLLAKITGGGCGAAASGGGGGGGGGGGCGPPSRCSPRSPTLPSCHVGSPLGPYHQQPLQQQKSYSRAPSRPTSPRSSAGRGCPDSGGGSGGGGGLAARATDVGTDRSVNPTTLSPPPQGQNGNPSTTPGGAGSPPQQQQQQYYRTCEDVRTSRTSPTVPRLLPGGPASDGRPSPFGGGGAAAVAAAITSAPTSPVSAGRSPFSAGRSRGSSSGAEGVPGRPASRPPSGGPAAAAAASPPH